MIQDNVGLPPFNNTDCYAFMHIETTRARRFAAWFTDLRAALRDYFGSIGRRRDEPINNRTRLRHFLETRASYVAQTALYGYLRTRAGMIYPQLFDNDEFVRSVNIAKWHVWLACVSDLTVYAGGLLAQQSGGTSSEIGALLKEQLEVILKDTGVPADADETFGAHAERVRARLAGCDWTRVTDDETPFSESPRALIRWAPVVENLKALDDEIVKNSVRFRWQEIRRDLRRNLDTVAVLRTDN